ncbi:MAG TPA: type II and III secretion system protein family protein [Rhizomicrobium sp.]|jgi:pilus assembly protein CpaC|nr:type II and III secretion system protein family protein [Rhizomicrobium sp.]
MTMRKMLLCLLLLGAAVGPAASAPASQVKAAMAAGDAKPDGDARILPIATRGQPTHQRVTLSLSKATILQLDTDARDALVSNPDIVDAVVKSPRRIFLLANKIGQTNAFFFDAGGRQILSLDITVEKDTSDLAIMMKQNLPNSDIQVSSLNDNVVLSGNVATALEALRAVDIASRFAGDPKKIVNMLKVTGGQQVMLRVRVSEMERQIAKQFGVNIASATMHATGSVPIALSTDNQFGLLGRALDDLSGGQVGQVCSTGANPLSGGTCTIGPNNVEGTFKALEQVGLLHTLAEPNLTAVSGETAKFLAGGEFPVPAGRDQQGNVSIQFKQFGVGLSFTPVVMSDGRISLQISTEVSELTNTGAFTLQGGTVTDGSGQAVTTPGLTIPALAVRRAETTVELPSGGSFAIAGLMQHTTKQMIDAFPGVKDLPVLGALFRSRDFQNDETELVVTVTAYLVAPTAASKLATPSDGFVPASDAETLLLGRLNAVHGPNDTGDKRQTPQAQADAGFVVR